MWVRRRGRLAHPPRHRPPGRSTGNELARSRGPCRKVSEPRVLRAACRLTGWPATALGRAHGDAVGGAFGKVIERRELDIVAVLAPQGGEDEFVGKPRVLGKEASVEVGADRVPAARPF